VLFSDLVGSTSLAERLDPEILATIVGAYHDLARRAIEHNGGTIAAFQGDGAIGLFGVPIAHEDDAARAARAGLDLLEGLDGLEPAARRGIVLEARVGIEAGELLSDLAKATSGTLPSDVFNTAARLQAAAEPGTILAGETAAHLLRGTATLQPLPPLRLKGKAEPLAVAQVIAAAPGTRRLSSSPFIGRDRDLAWLARALEDAGADGAPILVTVVGEPGIGKSRLLDAFAGRADGATVLRATVRQAGEGTSFEPVADLIRSATGGATADAAAERLGPLLAGRPDAAALDASLRSLLGLRDGSATDNAWALRRFIEAVGAARPVVLILDDLHWATPALLDLVEDTARWVRAAVLMLCGARPDLLDVRRSWGGGLSRSLTITVGPLDDAGSRALATAVLGPDAPQAERVVQAAEGNPLFVEQLAIEARELGDRWDPTASPTTIRSLLEARLDRCSPDVGRALGAASVQGSRFRIEILRKLLPDELPLDDALREAERAQLATEVEAGLGAFSHALVRETAYRRLPKTTRADLHAAVAGLLPEDDDEQAGAHLERAAALRAELGDPDAELERQAGERLARTGARAFARLDLTTAATELERAARLLPRESAVRSALLPDLAVALMESGRPDEAAAILAGAADDADAQGSTRDALRIRLQQLALLVYTEAAEDEIRRGIAEGYRLVEQLTRHEDDVGLAQGWTVVDYLHWLIGEMSLAEQAAGKSMAYAVRAGRSREHVQAGGDQSTAMLLGPRSGAQLAAVGAEHRRHPDPIVASGGEAIAAVAAGFAGDTAAYLDGEARWRAIVEANGLEWPAANTALAALVPALVLMHEPHRAEAMAREYLDTMERLGDVWLLNGTSWWLAIALDRQGRADEAAVIAESLEPTYRRMEAIGSINRAIALSNARATRGNVDEAIGLAIEAATIARSTDSTMFRSLALENLGLLQRRTDPSGAIATFEEALALNDTWGNAVGAARTRRTLKAWGAD
jgi:class 3 adenylate cyclase/tetratricopeptide (TPR) repeat protein